MNPRVDELKSCDEYVLLRTIHHSEIRSVVKSLILKRSAVLNLYAVFQIISLAIPVGLLATELFRAIHLRESYENVVAMLIAVGFSFTMLILLHEAIHLAGFKVLGKSNLLIRAEFKKFLFYVEAHLQVLNKRQYLFIAILPFISVLLITVTCIIIWRGEALMYFFITIGSLHTLFCAGDIAIINYMYSFKSEIYTYDDIAEKTTYFYQTSD